MHTTFYKRLFEVRFLHEYYLSDRTQNGTLFFSKSIGAQQDYLDEEVASGRYDIFKDLHIEPSPATARLLSGRRLKFKQTVTGFIVGAEVKMEDLNGAVKYKPATHIENGLRLAFFIRLKNRDFRAFTAMRMRQNDIPAYYLFTNAGKPFVSSAFVSLAEEPPVFASGNTYEPGELVRFNTDLKEAVTRTQITDTDHWSPVNAEGYVNENNRSVVSKRFSWKWTASPQSVRFSLINELLPPNEQELKVIHAVFTESNQTKQLDFSRKTPDADQTIGDAIPDGFYTLEVAGLINSFSRKIYLHSELDAHNATAQTPGLLGMVQIETTVNSAGVPFLDDAGYLRREPLPGGDSSHIIYEVRWLNRSAWWRYRSSQDKELKAIGFAIPHLTQKGKDLVSKRPLRLASFQKFLALGVNLPNATPELLRPDSGGRYYADIVVTKVPNLIDSI